MMIRRLPSARHGALRRIVAWLALLAPMSAGEAQAQAVARVTGGSVAAPAATLIVDVIQAGADPTGARNSDRAFSAAVDRCREAGGGIIDVPPGTYRISTLRLGSRMHLRFAAGAVLFADPDASLWTIRSPLVAIANAEDVAITGPGILDGRRATWFTANAEGRPRTRPAGPCPSNLVQVANSRRIRIDQVTLRDACSWTLVLERSQDLHVSRVVVRNPPYAEVGSIDGIDVCNAQRVLIEDCDVETADDGICIKTLTPAGQPYRVDQVPPVEDVLVRRCRVATTCNATKVGTETAGDVRDVRFEDIVVARHSGAAAEDRNPIPTGECISAFSAQSSDGGRVERIEAVRYRVEACSAPVFLVLQRRPDRFKTTPPPLGALRDILIADFDVQAAGTGSLINTAPGARIERVTIADFRVAKVAARFPDARDPTPAQGGYPDAHRYGPNPAVGWFARGVDRLTLSGTFAIAGADERTAVMLRDVTGFDDRRDPPARPVER